VGADTGDINTLMAGTLAAIGYSIHFGPWHGFRVP
jgi:hypothetical protein